MGVQRRRLLDSTVNPYKSLSSMYTSQITRASVTDQLLNIVTVNGGKIYIRKKKL